jgi:hypothetical protein
MKKGEQANRHRINICKYCGLSFNCFDKKATKCDDCKSIITFKCECGCGIDVTRVKFKSFKNKYASNHDKRGKTYEQIYGTSTPTCGFKRGLLNVNYTKPKYRRLKYENSIGQKFSSKLEVQFSEFLIKHNIKYVSEVKIELHNGKLKIVDFILNDYIIVEISGFAYDTWRQDFVEKMKVLRESIDAPILILTYGDNLDKQEIKSKLDECRSEDVFIESIDNDIGILNKIKLFNSIKLLNSVI